MRARRKEGRQREKNKAVEEEADQSSKQIKKKRKKKRGKFGDSIRAEKAAAVPVASRQLKDHPTHTQALTLPTLLTRAHIQQALLCHRPNRNRLS